MKKIISICLSFCLLITVATIQATPVSAVNINTLYMNQGHTIADIVSRYNTMQQGFNYSTPYQTTPNLIPTYNQGSLKTSTMQNGLNMLNFSRYLAGLNDVSLDATYNDGCQAGALVLESTLQFTHNPINYFNMDTTLFNKGAASCASSLLMDGIGYSDVALAAVVSAHLDNTNTLNSLEERRKLLNPKMGKTGFGLINSTSLVEANDTSNTTSNPNYVAWPSPGYFPIERFYNTDSSKGLTWSISLDSTQYGKNYSDQVVVTLQNKITNQTTVFSNGMSNADGSVFTINKNPYGMDYSIAFRPANSAIDIGNQFSVTVSGLRGVNGQNLDNITYDTAFFSVFDPEVNPSTYDVSITSDTERVDKGEPVTYTVLVKDQSGNPLSGLEVVIKLTDDVLNKYTDASGIVTFTLTPETPYNIQISVPSQFVGNTYYSLYQSDQEYIVPYVLGDINFDSNVDVNDLVIVKRILLHSYTPTSEEFAAADVDHNSKITISDLITIKKIILNIIV